MLKKIKFEKNDSFRLPYFSSYIYFYNKVFLISNFFYITFVFEMVQ